MKFRICIGLVFFPFALAFAQNGTFTVKVNKDTVYQDEPFKIEFILDNLTGNFIAPDFMGFKIVSGPNISSSYSMINGEVNQKKSYTYLLIPEFTGHQQIPIAEVKSENGEITSLPIDIYVLSETHINVQGDSSQRTYRYEAEENIQQPKTKKSSTKRVLKKI